MAQQIKAPEPSKAHEREFAEAMTRMVELMSAQFRRQVLLELNQSTIKKFADAQTGNYAKAYLKIAKRITRKLVNRFDDKRIERFTTRVTSKVDERNAKEFYARAERQVGISRRELNDSEGLTFQINAIRLETEQWVKKLRDDTLEQYVAGTLRKMAEGKGLEEILADFDDMAEKRKNHAKMVARTQIATFNSLTSKARAQKLGITKARWVTSHDERVRTSHKDRDGREFDLSTGCYSTVDERHLLPGVDYNCRCTYQMILPED